MAPDDRAGLTASDVHRWLWGLQWFHAARFAVMAAVVGATIVKFSVEPFCTPEQPSLCGPTPRSTWELALLFTSLVLLILSPGLGCLSALALGVLATSDDPTSIARGWWAAEAALSAAALVFLLLIRVHQHRVAARMKRPITLPVGRSATAETWGGRREQFWTPEGRAVFVGFAAATGIVLMLIYQYQVSASDEHLRNAVRATAVVQDIDSQSGAIDLYLPDTGQVVTVLGADVPNDVPNDYRIDQTLPVIVDSTGSEPWLRFIAKPDDQTPWLSWAILAWLLTIAAMLRPARVWWAQRRSQAGELRGILVSTRWPRSDDDAEISAADGSGLRLCVLRSPVTTRLVAGPDEDRFNEPNRDWTPPELVVVTGQLWYGGVVRLYALGGEVLGEAIMGLPQLTLLHSWRAAPTPSTVEGDDEFDGNAEPADSRALMVIDGDGQPRSPALTPFAVYDRSHHLIRWTLWFYAVLAVGTVGFVMTGVLRSDSEWWALVILPGIVLLCLVPFLPHLARAHVAVSEDGVTVVNSLSTYRIPWSAIEKVELRLARGVWQWGCSNAPEGDFQLVFSTSGRVITAEVPVGPDAPTGGMAALVNRIVDYRDRTQVSDGSHPVKVTGAAAHTRKVWLPVSEPLPPADRPVNVPGPVQDDVATSQEPNSRKASAWSALRAVSFGAAGAILGAAAYGALVIFTQQVLVLESMGLGAIVAFSVGLAGGALRRLWIGAISVLLTLLSLLLSEYVIARQDSGLTHAPLVLPPNETVTLIHDDLANNVAGLWFWGIALLFACGATARSRSPTENESARNEDAKAHPRAWRWISRRAWLGAGLAFATGLVALVVLAAVPLGPASQGPAPAVERDRTGQVTKATNVTLSDVKIGDCYNNTPDNSFDALPEVPCPQPHDDEVFYLFMMSAGKYPGDDAVQTSADNTCGEQLPDYVGVSPSALLDYSYLLPDQMTWASGDRLVICDLARSDGEKLNGTAHAAQ
jgi:hypothetical protein